MNGPPAAPYHRIRLYADVDAADGALDGLALVAACTCGGWQASFPDGALMTDINTAALDQHLAPGLTA
jgi:hypothetical protein